MGAGKVNPYEELKRLDEQIESAADVAALRPILARLNEIVHGFPGDLDVQLEAEEVRLRLIARGTLLKHQTGYAPPPPVAPKPAQAAPAEKPKQAALPEVSAPKPARRAWKRAALIALAGALIIAAGVLGNYYVTQQRAREEANKRPPAPVVQAPPPSIRLLTDLAQGKVAIDGQPPADLQDGQLVIDKAIPGPHTVKVTGPNVDASFAFEIAETGTPAVTGPISARNMIAVLVASFGKQARIVTNAGPWKLAVNGQAQADAGPEGTDITSFQQGVNEIVVGEGKDQRNMSESFGPSPTLTAFLKTDVNAGTLIVATGQDDVRVYLNGQEYKTRTKRGQLRIQTLGPVTVQVAKSGFEETAPQTVEVKKGAEVRVKFELTPQPQFSSLDIRGATPGAQVFINEKAVGETGPDGSFGLAGIQPGDHAVELRRENFLPKQWDRWFHANQPVILEGAEVQLAPALGVVRLARNPASATVTYRRGNETEGHEVRGGQIELLAGSYTFSASAPGFIDSTATVQVAAGEDRDLSITLREQPRAPAPPPAAHSISEFDDAAAWKQVGDTWTRKGGGSVTYKLPPKGVFTFTVKLLSGGGLFRSGKIRWFVQYLDAKNYLLSEMDSKSFWAGVIAKGERYERVKAAQNFGNQKEFPIEIDVTPERLVQKVRVGNEWRVLDSFAEPGRNFTQGKFGFLIQGNDEIGISDFKFQPQ